LVVDNDQGYGLISLASALKPSSGRRLVYTDRRAGLQTGQAWSRTVQLAGGGALRVVLAYSDFPGESLVNNLNLFLYGPGGTRYIGNQRREGSLALDAANNVELVDVPNARAGAWRIEVVGSNVPEGPQDFALVIIGRTS
jgi:hypothetical protein